MEALTTGAGPWGTPVVGGRDAIVRLTVCVSW